MSTRDTNANEWLMFIDSPQRTNTRKNRCGSWAVFVNVSVVPSPAGGVSETNRGASPSRLFPPSRTVNVPCEPANRSSPTSCFITAVYQWSPCVGPNRRWILLASCDPHAHRAIAAAFNTVQKPFVTRRSTLLIRRGAFHQVSNSNGCRKLTTGELTPFFEKLVATDQHKSIQDYDLPVGQVDGIRVCRWPAGY